MTLIEKARTHFWKPHLHELALHGAWKTTLGTAARFMARRTVPRVKLH